MKADKPAMPPVDPKFPGEKPEEEKKEKKESSSKKDSMIGGPEDDLTLTAALYGVLFQAYADKVIWLNLNNFVVQTF